jgi:hypothetical protein
VPATSPHLSRTWRAVVVAAACLAAACGKVGPPQPPLGRAPSRPSQIAAVQVGPLIRLSWLAPHLDLREKHDSAIRRADVYRLRQARDQSPVSLPDDFEAAADIVGFLDYDALKTQLTGADQLVFEDRLDLSQANLLANTRFQYAVRYVDARGRPQVFSNIVSVEPVPGIARPPTALAATQQQDQVILTWTPPAENIDGSVPAQVIGYNVYRAKPNADRFGRPVNDKLLTDPTFVDRNFLYQTPYVYVVRSVSQGPDQPVESSDSDRLAVTAKDTFPPSAPTNVTVASAGGVVSLFWPTNPESDVAGYYIYRADGEAGATAPWTRLTDKPITRTTYRDDRARLGARYSYRITAIDRYGNESQPSTVVTETASP